MSLLDQGIRSLFKFCKSAPLRLLLGGTQGYGPQIHQPAGNLGIGSEPY